MIYLPKQPAMQRLQAFKFELMPNGAQARQMRRFVGACRFVYNKALAFQKERHDRGDKKLGYAGLCKLLTDWRNDTETAWLAKAPVHPLQQTLKDLERAYTNFFAKRSGFPRFRRKGETNGFRYPDPKQFKLDESNAKLFLPKLGWVRYRKSRPVLGDLRQMTVTSAGGRWFISIQTEQECAVPVHPEQQREIAIDLGARKDFALAIGQDGAMVKTLNAYRKAEGRLRHLQRCLSRKKKGSKNRAKARHRLARCHFKVANQRKDFLHKASHILTRDYGVIVIEDLKVKEMTASKVNPKQRNKAILDQGWFMFRQMLQYKAQWRGGLVIAIDPAHTSTTCSACGHCNPLNRPSPDRFRCVACGHTMQADQNAAINIQRAGHARLVCGEDISQRESGVASMKQEHSRADRGSQ
jgi:putative transposase